MSDMKCPFCKQELEYLAEDIYGNMYCPDCRDKNGFTYKASESIWQELIRTHKALDKAEQLQKAVDLALDMLLEISDGYDIMAADSETIKRLFYTIQDNAKNVRDEIKQLIKETTNDK